MDLKLAANLTFLFKERPFLERFEAAASCGFTAVECGSEIYEENKEIVVDTKEKAGVQVILLNSPKGLALVGKENEFMQKLDLTIEYATALKCQKIHLVAGPLSCPMDWSNAEWQQAKATYLNNVKHAGEHCSKFGITVTLEAISAIPNYFLQTQKQAADIVRQIGKENVAVQFDFYHAQRTDGNLYEFIKNNIDIIGHIQVSQVPIRHEPDSDGEINYPFMFHSLYSLGYKGWIGCEYNPKGKVKDGLGWAKSFLK